MEEVKLVKTVQVAPTRSELRYRGFRVKVSNGFGFFNAYTGTLTECELIKKAFCKVGYKSLRTQKV